MPLVQVSLPDAAYDRLSATAKSRGITKSKLMRELLRAELGMNPNDPARQHAECKEGDEIAEFVNAARQNLPE